MYHNNIDESKKTDFRPILILIFLFFLAIPIYQYMTRHKNTYKLINKETAPSTLICPFIHEEDDTHYFQYNYTDIYGCMSDYSYDSINIIIKSYTDEVDDILTRQDDYRYGWKESWTRPDETNDEVIIRNDIESTKSINDVNVHIKGYEVIKEWGTSLYRFRGEFYYQDTYHIFWLKMGVPNAWGFLTLEDGIEELVRLLEVYFTS